MNKNIIKNKWLLLLSAGVLAGSIWYFFFMPWTEFRLTQEEQQWLDVHRTFRLAPNHNFAPFEFNDSSGTYVGLSADLFTLIGKQLGVTFTIVRIDSPEERWKAAREKQVDLLGGVRESPERIKDCLFTNPIAFSQDVIVTLTNYPYAVTIDSLNWKRVAVPEGTTKLEGLRKTNPKINLIPGKSAYESLLDVSLGRADAAIVSIGSASYYILNKGLPNLKVAGFFQDKSPVSFAVRNDWPLFRSILNKVLVAIPEDERDKINKKWLGLQIEPHWWNQLPWQWITGAIAFLALLAAAVLVWNRSLQHQVKAKTIELERELQEHRGMEEALRESEEQFSLAMDATSDGLWDWDITYSRVYYSPGYFRILGYEPNEFGNNLDVWKVLIHPDDYDRAVANNEACLNNVSQSIYVEYRMKAKDGTWRWILGRGKAVQRDAKGKALRMIGTHVDISGRKRTEELLAQEKERLSVTLRSIGDGVITTDTNGAIVMLNKAAEQMTGWGTEEAAGRLLPEVFVILNELTREPCENPAEQVLSTGNIVELASHTCLISKDGREMLIADSGAPIRDNMSRIAGVVIVFRDMTEKLKLHDSMQRTQKLESIGILAGGIAHDFNNLLGGIFGYLEMAKDDASAGKFEHVPKYLHKALGVFDRAKGLTQQLLTFSKGGAPIRKTMNIAPLVQHSAAFALSGSNVTCQFHFATDLWMCDCDENQIGQAVDNIVINAKQAMPMGGTIIISADNAASEPGHAGIFVKISIKDQGVGMPKEILSRIFDPFFSTKETGHGLGLATVHSIVKRHGGWIDVESKSGKGSTFDLFIPASQKSISVGADQNPVEHKGCGHILMMDDEEFMLEIAGTMLQEMGYTIARAKNGPEALALFTQAEKSGQPYVAAILDLTIPGGTGGKEIAAAMRKMNPDSIMIASSGYSEDPEMSNPTKNGFTDRIIKPYRKNELMELLARIAKDLKNT